MKYIKKSKESFMKNLNHLQEEISPKALLYKKNSFQYMLNADYRSNKPNQFLKMIVFFSTFRKQSFLHYLSHGKKHKINSFCIKSRNSSIRTCIYLSFSYSIIFTIRDFIEDSLNFLAKGLFLRKTKLKVRVSINHMFNTCFRVQRLNNTWIVF